MNGLEMVGLGEVKARPTINIKANENKLKWIKAGILGKNIAANNEVIYLILKIYKKMIIYLDSHKAT